MGRAAGGLVPCCLGRVVPSSSGGCLLLHRAPNRHSPRFQKTQTSVVFFSSDSLLLLVSFFSSPWVLRQLSPYLHSPFSKNGHGPLRFAVTGLGLDMGAGGAIGKGIGGIPMGGYPAIGGGIIGIARK